MMTKSKSRAELAEAVCKVASKVKKLCSPHGYEEEQDYLAFVEAVEAWHSAPDSDELIFQYYYKRNECPAENAASADCICWYNEGTGPFKNERHNAVTQKLEWRRGCSA